MKEQAITVNAAILAICTAVGRVLSLYAYNNNKYGDTLLTLEV